MIKEKNLAILASGNGTGFEAIYKSILTSELTNLSCKVVISNNTSANVLQKAKFYKIDNYIINKNNLHTCKNEDKALEYILEKHNCDYIFLSGYMKKIPDTIVKKYDKKIINSHPSLLPKYGGKGMYGKFVHEAVIKNNEKQTGVTIHFVNEVYDEGEIIFQEVLEVKRDDTSETLEKKVKELEKKTIIKAFKKIIN